MHVLTEKNIYKQEARAQQGHIVRKRITKNVCSAVGHVSIQKENINKKALWMQELIIEALTRTLAIFVFVYKFQTYRLPNGTNTPTDTPPLATTMCLLHCKWCFIHVYLSGIKMSEIYNRIRWITFTTGCIQTNSYLTASSLVSAL